MRTEGLASWLLRASGAKECVARAESMQGGLERSLCEAVKVSPRLQWRLQDVGDTITLGRFSRRAVSVEWR